MKNSVHTTVIKLFDELVLCTTLLRRCHQQVAQRSSLTPPHQWWHSWMAFHYGDGLGRPCVGQNFHWSSGCSRWCWPPAEWAAGCFVSYFCTVNRKSTRHAFSTSTLAVIATLCRWQWVQHLKIIFLNRLSPCATLAISFWSHLCKVNQYGVGNRKP